MNKAEKAKINAGKTNDKSLEAPRSGQYENGRVHMYT